LDIKEHLILVKQQDKTKQIEHCKNNRGKWDIKYNNTNKVYSYSSHNVLWYRNPKKLDSTSSIVYEENQPLSGIKYILDFGTYIRLIFNSGFNKTYPSSTLTIEQSALSNKQEHTCFDYLKTLANEVSFKLDDDVSFLSKQYNKISSISPSSVLSAYLGRKPLKSSDKQQQLIFPFGFNVSQKSATEKAMSEQASIIEGPPGTGKTQTILNIIANAVVNNKTVAVVSNNNSATANVLEKLEKYGLDFIAAYLGNKENKEAFFAQQTGVYPDISDWKIEESEYDSVKENLKQSQHKLNDMLEYKNKQAMLKQELSELQTEYEYFNDYYSASNFKKLQMKSIYPLHADKVLKLLMEYKQRIENGKVTLKHKLYNLLVHGIYNFNLYKHQPEFVFSFLQETYYELKIKELKSKVEELGNKLEGYNFESEMKQYRDDSMKLFKASLVKKFGIDKNRQTYSAEVLWKGFERFIKDYPVILSTTHSLRNSSARNYLFDYVLIDEASQVDVVTGALALSCAKNAVIVGDTKQLPNVVTKEVKEKTSRIFNSYNLDQAYNYAEHSLLSSIESLFKEIPKTLLKNWFLQSEILR